MAIDAAECLEMIAAVERAGVKLQIGFRDASTPVSSPPRSEYSRFRSRRY